MSLNVFLNLLVINDVKKTFISIPIPGPKLYFLSWTFLETKSPKSWSTASIVLTVIPDRVVYCYVPVRHSDDPASERINARRRL